MPTLEEFVEHWNTGDYKPPTTLTNHTNYSRLVYASFLDKYCTEANRNHIGLSELGKPGLLLALKKLHLPIEDSKYTELLTFHYGDWFEALVTELIEMYGIFVQGKQSEVEYMGVVGHIDGVADGRVIEVKSLSGRNYTRFSKPVHPSKPWIRRISSDIYGYNSQLAIYTYCLNKDGVWLTLNKETRELALVYMDEDFALEAMLNASDTIQKLDKVNTLDDALSVFPIPDPTPEVFKKKPSGLYLVPESMQYTPLALCFYEMFEGINGYKKPTTYIRKILDREEILDNFLDSGVVLI